MISENSIYAHISNSRLYPSGFINTTGMVVCHKPINNLKKEKKEN